jgi:hypothetical protein
MEKFETGTHNTHLQGQLVTATYKLFKRLAGNKKNLSARVKLRKGWVYIWGQQMRGEGLA